MTPLDENGLRDFEQDVLTHLDAAYSLARWLTRNDQDAQDVVQEACIRAFRCFAAFQGEDARPWLLKIVRNTCYTWLQRNRRLQPIEEFDENRLGTDTSSPRVFGFQNDIGQLLREALEALPLNFREVLILRELEGLSYREIAEITGMPTGTVMSRLARARHRVREICQTR